MNGRALEALFVENLKRSVLLVVVWRADSTEVPRPTDLNATLNNNRPPLHLMT